jgi:hypothetical protein
MTYNQLRGSSSIHRGAMPAISLLAPRLRSDSGQGATFRMIQVIAGFATAG